VSTAVTNAHQHAKEAQGKVVEASVLAKQVQTEAAALKDAPPTLVAKVNELEGKLNETTQSQTKLESDLQEADKAKAQVEKDKTDYFDSAQKLADAASQEREKRIKAESSLHWYRMHWWGAWIVFGLGILACIVLAVLKFTGKLLL
jgi:chromosome segregation ATPase